LTRGGFYLARATSKVFEGDKSRFKLGRNSAPSSSFLVELATTPLELVKIFTAPFLVES
jgi:hypothetical protein